MSEIIEGQAEEVKAEEVKKFSEEERKKYIERIGNAVIITKEVEREINIALDQRSVIDIMCFLAEFEARIKVSIHQAMAGKETECKANVDSLKNETPNMISNLINGIEDLLAKALEAKAKAEEANKANQDK